MVLSLGFCSLKRGRFLGFFAEQVKLLSKWLSGHRHKFHFVKSRTKPCTLFPYASEMRLHVRHVLVYMNDMLFLSESIL